MNTIWKYVAGMGFLLLAAAPLIAEGDPAKPDFEIPKTHIEVRVLSEDEVPKVDPVPKEVREKEEPKKPEDPMEALRLEVQTVRDELRLLQATLDLLVNQVMADQRKENEFLRGEILRLSEQYEKFGLPDPARVPRPGIDIIREVLESQGQTDPESGKAEEHAPAMDSPWENLLPPEESSGTAQEIEPEIEEGEPAPFAFTALQEWGRTPEAVAELGGDAASLKGIVGIVPPRSRRDDIEKLGRDLRKQYEGYDNINIEVYDNEDAARRYMDTQVGDTDHRVLSVSKHAASGRDIILYLKKGEAVEIAP